MYLFGFVCVVVLKIFRKKFAFCFAISQLYTTFAMSNKQTTTTQQQPNTMAIDFSKLAQIKVSEPTTKEYKLMYYVGVWFTAEKFCAESEEEAIFDADAVNKCNKLDYALFCGNKIVKTWAATADKFAKVM